MKDFRVEFGISEAGNLDRTAFAGVGYAVEHVAVSAGEAYEFTWTGETHYLALHDLVLREGETHLDGATENAVLDLTDRLTFAPAEHAISGWSSLAPRKNSYTALFIDPALAREELEKPLKSSPPPELYFRDAGLRATLLKLNALLASGHPVDGLHVETLALLAALEVDQRHRDHPDLKRPPQLSRRQQKLVEEYVAANLSRSLTLQELAGLVGLSRFHFTRLFAASFGVSPLAWVRAKRIERAMELLAIQGHGLADIADATGFSSPASFSNAFRKIVGVGPRDFRRR